MTYLTLNERTLRCVTTCIAYRDVGLSSTHNTERQHNMASEETLKHEIEALKADLSALRLDFKGLGKDMASAARVGASAAKDHVRSAMDSAKEQGEDAAKKVKESIEERPLTSVAIAFGAGILLGVMLKK